MKTILRLLFLPLFALGLLCHGLCTAFMAGWETAQDWWGDN
jgi:hypothetical protein